MPKILTSSTRTITTKPLYNLRTMASNTNPGNFSNRSHEEVQNIARKGGQSSHSGGFASMDPEKQRDIASQGGHASSGSFKPGDPKARAAGQKGGSKSQYDQETPDE